MFFVQTFRKNIDKWVIIRLLIIIQGHVAAATVSSRTTEIVIDRKINVGLALHGRWPCLGWCCSSPPPSSILLQATL